MTRTRKLAAGHEHTEEKQDPPEGRAFSEEKVRRLGDCRRDAQPQRQLPAHLWQEKQRPGEWRPPREERGKRGPGRPPRNTSN